jgi:prepilin-type N-terminal cleavage/methylation domain-containing protein
MVSVGVYDRHDMDKLECRANREQNGFSLVELMMVCAIIAIIATAAVPMLQSTMQRSDADSAAQLIVQELSMARAMAVSVHGPILVQFDPVTNSVTLAPGTGSVRGPFILPGGITFMNSAPASDTPDALGAMMLGTGSHTKVTFLDNGTAATDASGTTLCSGTYFLQHANGDAATIRAVTICGGTGKARVWKYDPIANSWN